MPKKRRSPGTKKVEKEFLLFAREWMGNLNISIGLILSEIAHCQLIKLT